MNYNTATLSNGLRVIHLHVPGQQVIYCGFAIAAGTRHELPGEEGLAHFVEHTTFKGTTKRCSIQILNCLENIGGDLNAFTTKEHTIYYATVLRDHFGRAATLLCDIVFNSIYPQTELDKEKEVICEEIESYNDTPSELIFDEFENHLFTNHPLGHNILGTNEQLRTYTTADALRFAHRHYRPDNSIFFAYGDINFTSLIKKLETNTSDLRPQTSALKPQTSALKPQTSAPKPQPSAQSPSYHQAHVMLGTKTFGADHPQRIPLFLLNNILGGPGMNARLNIALRERRGLVYTVESNMTTYTDIGTWAIYFGCDHKDVKRCLQLVRRELDHIMEKPLTERQLTVAKQQLKGQLAIAADNREQLALDIAKTYLHEHREHHLSDLFERINDVTATQIHQLAQELFATDRLQTLVL